MNQTNLKFLFFILFLGQATWAVRPDLKTLPIGLTAQEKMIQSLRSNTTVEAGTAPREGAIHSLGEWEEASEVMILWPNPSYMKALSENGQVRLLADSPSDKTWWQNWIIQQKLTADRFSYFVVPTDSIWVRDYGPWPIVDSDGKFGLVDTVYNRPRPNDDMVPDFLGQALNLPVYKIGLVHTGGNYYSDGVGNAFSSTLVFTENPKLDKKEIDQRMSDFLGIDQYVTSPLSPKITIEHLDTFGKLVAPDTWVFSEFPKNSKHYADSERMVALLKTLISPYGTPYKIFRMKMTTIPGKGAEVYRAYINSFISNGALYFPIYGDSVDAAATKVYQEALPGYKIVGVDNGNTEWGDSVHCRSRNLIKPDTTFIFPKVISSTLRAGLPISIIADVYPETGTQIKTVDLIWNADAGTEQFLPMERTISNQYSAQIPPQTLGTKVSMHIRVEDTSGRVKTAPIRAPAMKIEAVVSN
jgi:agmatine deiminase